MAAVRITKIEVEEIDTDNIIEAVRRSRMSYVALSRQAGLHDQFVTRLCRGLIKEVPQEVFDALAVAMVNQGDFKGASKKDVLAVMRGRKSFHLRLVADGQPDNPTSVEVTTKPYAFPAAVNDSIAA